MSSQRSIIRLKKEEIEIKKKGTQSVGNTEKQDIFYILRTEYCTVDITNMTDKCLEQTGS